jgi:hypothetical protein
MGGIACNICSSTSVLQRLSNISALANNISYLSALAILLSIHL